MAYYKYYVYTLAYPDDRIFYVGKGQGDRMHQHEEEASQYSDPQAVRYLPKESVKIRVIKEIWASGGEVVKTKVFETDEEEEANAYEKQFIAQCDKRYLTNRTKGGGPQFSKQDPYARLKHRDHFYSPKEAREKLGISLQVWNRLILAGVLHLYKAEGSTFLVLDRKEIDNFAKAIKDGSYPIDVWEDTPHTKQHPLWDDQSPPQQTKEKYPLSRSEMLGEVATFALHAAQQAYSASCNLIGSYEGEIQEQRQKESLSGMSKQKIQRFSTGELIRYASHEAGHAVVGHVIGRLSEEVTIVPDRERGYKGYCRFSDFMESANDHLQWQRERANPEIITILYAGTVAMEIVCVRHSWEYELWRGCDQADLDAIDEWCLEMLAGDDHRAAVKATCLAQARDMLISHWDAVDALATKLVVYGQVTGGEAHRIIRQALGETGPDWRLTSWNIVE